MTTDGDEIGVLDYVVSSMAVFFGCVFYFGFILLLYKSPNFL
jgi:hypothetical protein